MSDKRLENYDKIISHNKKILKIECDIWIKKIEEIKKECDNKNNDNVSHLMVMAQEEHIKELTKTFNIILKRFHENPDNK